MTAGMVGGGSAQAVAEADQIEAYIFAQKYFTHDKDEFEERFKQLIWITYCKRFKPLMIELDSWHGQPVQSLQTDNQWGCTVRCLQMLIANALDAADLEIPAQQAMEADAD